MVTTDESLERAGAPEPARRFNRTPAWWRGLREIVLIVALWLFYSVGRNLADTDHGPARSRGLHIYHLEQTLHLNAEHFLNHATYNVTWISVIMCFWYAALHYTVTPLCLAFVWFRHQHDYARVRNAIVMASAVALVVYIFWPTAPPRLMDDPSLWRDTLGHYAQYGWWTDHASAPAGMQQLTNEYAAMPSLHVGWTVWVAWVGFRFGGKVWGALGVVYVLGTAFVVFCTGNHWVLDVIAGCALVLLSIYTVNHVEPLRRDDGFVRMFYRLGRRLRRVGRPRAEA